jgi:hypothetical protein
MTTAEARDIRRDELFSRFVDSAPEPEPENSRRYERVLGDCRMARIHPSI